MVKRVTVNRVVFVGATISVFAGWMLAPSGEATGNLSTVLVSTGFFAGLWSVLDIPREELVFVTKAFVWASIGFAVLAGVVALVGTLVDGLLTPELRTWIVLLGQSLGTMLLVVLPVLVGRELLRRFREGSGWSGDDRGETPEERVLSDSEYEDFDRL